MSDLVLVTGADGLLGSHLVRRLLEQGFRVRVFLQSGSTSPTLSGLNIEKFAGDLTRDHSGLTDAVRDCRFVFHVAAVTDMWASPETTWMVNCDGTRRVVNACIEAHVERLVFTGSASTFQFGSLEQPGTEQNGFPAAYRGVAYMESKHRATRLVQEAVRHQGLNAVVVSPTFLLGDLDWRPSSGELIRQFVRRGMRFVSSGGRNFAYAPDVAEAMVLATEKGEPGACFIAGGTNMNYFDFFSQVSGIVDEAKPPMGVLPGAAVLAAGALGSALGKVTGRKVAINRTIARASLLDTYYSSEKAVRVLGMPQTDIGTAIESSVRSLKDYGHI